MVGGDIPVSSYGIPEFLSLGWQRLTSVGLDLRLSVWICPCFMLQLLLTMH